MKIAVLMGGISSEREVSLRTGNAILNALKELKYDAFAIVLEEGKILNQLQEAEYDIAFIALHGEYGEDGRIQAVLDILGKKYTGCGLVSSAITIDKEFTKKLIMHEGIKVPKSYKNVEEIDCFPVVIKPSLEGSSVGLHICNNTKEAEEAVKSLVDKKLSIEQFVKGEEITVGVLHGEALGVLKIMPKSGVYDYKSKYTKGETEFQFPAVLENGMYEKAMKTAEVISSALELKGAPRIDMIISAGEIYVLEVNTIPGMTETSLLPKIASLKGYGFKELVEKILKGQ